MPRLTLLVLWASLGLLNIAAAQGHLDRPDAGLPPPPPPPYPLPHDAALPPQPVSLPPDVYSPDNYQYVAPPDSRAAAKEPTTDRIHHLREAADHLEAAGLAEQSRELRRQAAELAAVLAEKLAQLKKLQAEIDQLSKTASARKPAAHLRLQVQIVQVSREKLPAGDDAAAILRQVVDPAPDKATAQGDTRFAMGLQSPGVVEKALTKLRQSGAIKVLAEPVLITTSGQVGSFFMGQERPVLVPVTKDASAVEFKKAGIQIDVLPVLCEGGFVRLEVRPRITTIDEDGAVKLGDHAVPRMRTREVDVGVEIRLGQTLMLGCLAPPHADSKDRPANATAEDKAEQDLVVVVTPTLLEPAAIPNVPPGPTAEKRDSWWDSMWLK